MRGRPKSRQLSHKLALGLLWPVRVLWTQMWNVDVIKKRGWNDQDEFHLSRFQLSPQLGFARQEPAKA